MRFSPWMLLTAALALVSALPQANAQQTTNTNCRESGYSVNCTSTTTDNTAANQQIGDALGTGIARAMEAGKKGRWVKKFCARHPGGGWYWHEGGTITDRGTCPTSADERVEAANVFMSKHKDYVPEPANSKVMVAYLDTHNLDPREEKSYERGYKDLKKSGQLHLYSK